MPCEHPKAMQRQNYDGEIFCVCGESLTYPRRAPGPDDKGEGTRPTRDYIQTDVVCIRCRTMESKAAHASGVARCRICGQVLTLQCLECLEEMLIVFFYPDPLRVGRDQRSGTCKRCATRQREGVR